MDEEQQNNTVDEVQTNDVQNKPENGTKPQEFDADKLVDKLQKRIGKEQVSKNSYKDRLAKAEAKIKELQVDKSVKEMSYEDKAKQAEDEKDKTIKDLQAKLARQTSIAETDKVFKEAGLSVSDDVLNMVVTTNDKQTYANAKALIDYTNQVQETVRKSYLKGSTPKVTGQHVVTKEEIMKIPDQEQRLKAIREHLDLFQGGK
ncbi:capsid assembly scaffolding protein Gp46 family protein [Limosilactobacillus reuteri]|uniref:capsid assembly scaffolding protein Gp46 family protein n=1 Tax=Limosilactobacillus reuteri TaxID=1598 RepID=UPI00177DD31D|nr:DUF4355 domain-containing protein [Limosilactobacillus reuteri]